MRRLCLLVGSSLLLVVSISSATIFGTVRGLVHDPQHRPVADAQVALKAKASAFALTAQSDANGEFHFASVITPCADAASLIYANSGYLPAGDYWRLGMIFGAIFLGVLLLLGVPWAGILWAR